MVITFTAMRRWYQKDFLFIVKLITLPNHDIRRKYDRALVSPMGPPLIRSYIPNLLETLYSRRHIICLLVAMCAAGDGIPIKFQMVSYRISQAFRSDNKKYETYQLQGYGVEISYCFAEE